MKPILDNAVLGSHLDCAGKALLDFDRILPAPDYLVSIDDARLTDARPMLPGSVTDESVAVIAAIHQDKLDFNGNIPAPWLGTGPGQAAPGNLVERIANKGAPGGYAALDGNGMLPASHVTPGASSGKVNSVKLVMPKEFTLSNSLVVASGVLTATWANVPSPSWFGMNGTIGLSSTLVPSFVTSKVPSIMLPGIDAAKFTTGVFDSTALPEAQPMGVSHAAGVVPDPQEKGDPNDYLSRDISWRPFIQELSYQPTVPDVKITVNSVNSDLTRNITIRSDLKGSMLFYRVDSPDFLEVLSGGNPDNTIAITVDENAFIEAYSAKAGYNNSAIAALRLSPPSLL